MDLPRCVAREKRPFRNYNLRRMCFLVDTYEQILSHSSPFASKIPDDVREKVEASGLGLLLPWAPQQYILAHAVRNRYTSSH